MKKCLQLIVLLSLLVFSSCASTMYKKYGITKEKPFKILDSIELSQENRFFSVEKPKDWYAFVEGHGGLYYSPQKIENTRPLTFGSHVGFRIKENKNIKWKDLNDYVDTSIKNLKKTYKKFNFKQIEMNHKKYGKCKVVIYVSTSWYDKNIQYETANFYIFYKNKGYLIFYRSKVDAFDKYLPEVEKMVNSFTIKE